MKLGTEKLGILLLGVVAFGNQLGKSLADGYQPADIAPLFGAAFPLLGSFSSLSEVKEELNDLNDEEKQKLVADVKTTFKLESNEAAEEKIEWAVEMVAHLWRAKLIFLPKTQN